MHPSRELMFQKFSRHSSHFKPTTFGRQTHLPRSSHGRGEVVGARVYVPFSWQSHAAKIRYVGFGCLRKRAGVRVNAIMQSPQKISHAPFLKVVASITHKLTLASGFRVWRRITIVTNFAEFALIVGTVSRVVDTLETISSLGITILYGVRINVAIAVALFARRLRTAEASRITVKTINTGIAKITLKYKKQVEVNRKVSACINALRTI